MIRLAYLFRGWKNFLPDRLEKKSIGLIISHWVKVSLDTTAALAGLIVLSPVFALIGFLIKRDTPGPIFYWSPRTGKGGQTFRMLKFRTMYESPESYRGLRVTYKGDERITPLGRWLRDSKVNEFPQLWNVLIGEMSLVGPRPEDPTISQNWPIEASREILSVKPGITSPASILYHDEETLLSSDDVMGDYLKTILPDKMRLDRLYVRNHSFWSDLDILFWTIAIVFPKLVKTRVPEGHLFGGWIFRLFHRHISWFVIDLVTALIAVSVVGILWHSQEPINWGFESFALLAIILALLFSGFNVLVGFNRIEWSRSTIEDVLGLVASNALVILFVLGLNALHWIYWGDYLQPLSKIMLFLIGLATQIGFLATRCRWHLISALEKFWLSLRRKGPGVGENVLIIGTGEVCDVMTWVLRWKKFYNLFNIVGIVDDNIPHKYGMRVDGCKILGAVRNFPELIDRHDVSLVLCTIPNAFPGMRQSLLKLSQNSDVRVVFLDKLMKLVSRQLTPSEATCGSTVGLENNLEALAMYDDVTGLPNYSLFQDRLHHSIAHARRYQTRLAVLLISLNGLTNIHDRYGSEIRNHVVREAAKRLSQCTRGSDSLACLEDHEFAIILEANADQEFIPIVIQRISDYMERPFKIDSLNLQVKANIKCCMDIDVCQKQDWLEFVRVNGVEVKGGQIGQST